MGTTHSCSKWVCTSLTTLSTPGLAYLPGLRSTVLDLLSDSVTQHGVSSLVSLSQAIAITILRHKRQTEFIAQMGGIRDADLAD